MIPIDHSFRAALFACMVFGCASSAATAADTQSAWNGLMENTLASSTCTTQNVGGSGVGLVHVSVYRPHILSTDTPTYLSIIFDRAAFTLQNEFESTNPQMKGNGTYAATVINGRGKSGTFTGNFAGIAVTPSPVTEATSTVTITGTIDNYFDVSGCTVTFKAAYVKE